MESWMIQVLLAFITFIAIMAVNKYKTEQNEKTVVKEIKDREKEKVATDKSISTLGNKVEELTKENAEHKIRLANAPSMEQVRAEFISKEMFTQNQKHFDERFDGVGKLLDGIANTQTLMFQKLEELRK